MWFALLGEEGPPEVVSVNHFFEGKSLSVQPKLYLGKLSATLFLGTASCLASMYSVEFSNVGGCRQINNDS